VSPAKIAQQTSAIKAFSNLYLHKIMEYTRADLLHRIEPYNPRPVQTDAAPAKPKEFTSTEVDALMSCHDTSTALDKRDRALAALVLATGLRITAAAQLPYAHYDPVAGVVNTVDKRRRRLAHLTEASKRAMRDWLRVRPQTGLPVAVRPGERPAAQQARSAIAVAADRAQIRSHQRTAYCPADHHQASASGGRRPNWSAADDGLGKPGDGLALCRRGCAGGRSRKTGEVRADLADKKSDAFRNPVARLPKIRCVWRQRRRGSEAVELRRLNSTETVDSS
jgi:integrase-like protein